MRRLAVLILFILAVGGLWYSYNVYWRAPYGPALSVEIKPGMGGREIAKLLEEKDIIGSSRLFLAYGVLTKKVEQIKAGTFSLRAGLNLRELYGVLLQATSQELRLTFPEGWNLREIAAFLQKQGIIGGPQELYVHTGAPAVDYRKSSVAMKPPSLATKFPFLKAKPSYVSLEGYLFPDTYQFRAGATVEDIVEKMLATFTRKVVNAYGADIDASGHTLHEIVTMASILEREVPGASDRRQVSDILWRRSGIGMALQVDSSVNYATGKDGLYTSKEDRNSSSLWNTYEHPGLPLGPIGNPGADAIDAALHPKQNSYWYFLTAPDGQVYYGRTLEEHNRNKVHLR